MITAKKARDLALGELNWWEKWRRNSNESTAIYNCSYHWFEYLTDQIERAAKNKEWSHTDELLPNFYSTNLIGGSPNLCWFDYAEQINLAQEAMFKLKQKIESKGFRVDFNTVKMSDSELNNRCTSFFHERGKVDIKFENTVDWKLI